METRSVIRRGRRPKRLPLVISLFLASLLGAPSAAIGAVATISPVTPAAAAVPVTPETAAESAGHPVGTDQPVPVEPPRAAVAPRPVVGPVTALTDQSLLAARVPRGPPLCV